MQVIHLDMTEMYYTQSSSTCPSAFENGKEEIEVNVNSGFPKSNQ